MILIAHPDSPRSTARLLQRSFFLALLGLLCLSNIVVQGQGSSTTSAASITTSSGGTSGTPLPGTVSGTLSGTATSTASMPTVTTTPKDPISLLTMLQPKVNLQNPPLFPIGVDIQFAWDYDKYLLLPPVNLTIEAFMVNDPKTIVTIGDGLPGGLKNYTWPAASQINNTHPLVTAMYTLRIFDGRVGRSGSLPGAGGYLSTFAGLKFGLYQSKTYTPAPVCATCQFANTKNDAIKTLLPAFSALALTVMSTLVVMA